MLFQLQFLTFFLREGGQLWMLDDLGTQVGFLTENSASTSDFNWSQEHIKANRFASVAVLFIDEFMPLI